MGVDIQYFNSKEAAGILGVNVSTIKRWTKEGKLACVKTAGGHRKFMMEHLAAFLEQHDKKKTRAQFFPLETPSDAEVGQRILKGDYDVLQEPVLAYALSGNRTQLYQVLSGLYLAQHPLHETYDLLLTPVLHRVGALWIAGEISIIQEHIATQTIRDAIVRLQGVMPLPEEKIGAVLCLNPPGELHDLPLKMVDHILEQRGFEVFFCGQMTPSLRIEEVFQKLQPQRLYISSIFVNDPALVQAELDQLFGFAAQYDIQVFVGGTGFNQLSFDHSAVVRRLVNFEEVATC